MTPEPALRFGRFEISAAERVLRIDGEVAPVGARAFDLLLALAQRRDRLVGKQELLDLVWPGLVVEEHNITTQVSTLRKLLGASVIATVPGRGYRFVAAPDAKPAEAPVAAVPPLPLHRLPTPRSRFIGRETVLADLERLLRASRVLTLTGVGGCGKTRLALACAQRLASGFADGVFFVDLAPLHESDRVAAACATTLGLPGGTDPPNADQVADQLSSREVLVVLDNCEQVRTGAAAFADALLARPGASRVLATSREPLAVAGEQLYPVPPLALPATPAVVDVAAAEAVQVFVERARQALPQFRIDDGNAAAVAEICRRLDGIALAIELAAARVPMLSAADIAARLHDRLRLLAAGSAAVARQQGLRTTMQWSYDLLSPGERRAFECLGVFVGGWTLEGGAAVLGSTDDYEALALLTALHDRSLLLVRRGVDARPRYEMLETVRQYARERLDGSEDASGAHIRHAAFLLALAESAAPHLRGPQQSHWMQRLDEERENLVAAIAWCSQSHSTADPQWALRLAASTARYWLFVDVELGSRLLRAALERNRDGGDGESHCEALLGLAALCMHRGRGEEGLPHARAALAMAERMGAVALQARAWVAAGGCLRSDDNSFALSHYKRGRDLARAAGCAVVLPMALNNIANIDFEQGRVDAAIDGYREALHLSRALGDVRGALINLHNLIRVLVSTRRHEEARQCALEAERMLRDVSESALKLEWLEVCAGLAASLGEHQTAARLWGVATLRFTHAGYRRPEEDQRQLERLSALARAAIGEGAFERAMAEGRALDLDAATQELSRWLAAG